MASQLKNIIHVDLSSGGTTTVPHHLNWNGVAVVPDCIEASRVGFAIDATDTNLTVTGTGIVDVLVESWHTYEREFGDKAVKVLSPQPFIPFGGASGSGAGTPAVFVYRPGEPFPAGNVFATWATCYAAAHAAQGARTIEIDDIHVSPAVIPAGTYDFTDITIAGTWNRQNFLEFAAGVITHRLRSFRTHLLVTCAGPAPIADFADSDTIEFDDDVRVIDTAGGSLLDFTNTSDESANIVILKGSQMVSSGVPNILAGPGALILNLLGGPVEFSSSSPLSGFSVQAGTGSVRFLSFGTAATGTTNVPANGGNFLVGAPTYACMTMIPQNSDFSGAIDGMSVCFLVDTAGGNVTCVNLLPCNLVNGQKVTFKKLGADGNSVIIGPHAGDTIDGNPSVAFTNAQGSLTLLSDGVSNWMVVAKV